jgi:hypothetical protein
MDAVNVQVIGDRLSLYGFGRLKALACILVSKCRAGFVVISAEQLAAVWQRVQVAANA